MSTVIDRSRWPGPRELRGYSARDAFMWYVCEAWPKFFGRTACPKHDECALNKGARTCKHCGRNWPPDDTWPQSKVEQVFYTDYGLHIVEYQGWRLELRQLSEHPVLTPWKAYKASARRWLLWRTRKVRAPWTWTRRRFKEWRAIRTGKAVRMDGALIWKMNAGRNDGRTFAWLDKNEPIEPWSPRDDWGFDD